MATLNDKQRLFVAEYLKDLNATQAAIRAGYSEKTARQMGAQNLSKPVIAKAIAEAKEKRIEDVEIDAAYVLQRHKEIDQLDILDIVKDDMSGFRPLSEWPKAWRQSISGIDIAEMFDYTDGEKELAGLIKKIKWPDKTKNLELLGKHVDVQAYRENVNANHSGTCAIMPVPTAASAEEWEKAAQEQHEAVKSQ